MTYPDYTQDDCRKCGGTMKPGKAMGQTFVGGVPDFIGETHSSTFSAGGPGVLIDCMKCVDCGWSVTPGQEHLKYGGQKHDNQA